MGTTLLSMRAVLSVCPFVKWKPEVRWIKLRSSVESLQIMTFSSACKVAQRIKWKLKVFADGIERPILARSHLRINAEARECPEFQQFLICCDMGPDLPLVLSHQRLQWLFSDLSHRCLPTPLIAPQLLVSQKEAFPLYFFFFLKHLFLALSNCEQLRRGTTGPVSVHRFPKNSGLLIKISPNNDSFKPRGYNWKIRHDITLSTNWWSLNRPVLHHLRTT